MGSTEGHAQRAHWSVDLRRHDGAGECTVDFAGYRSTPTTNDVLWVIAKGTPQVITPASKSTIKIGSRVAHGNAEELITKAIQSNTAGKGGSAAGNTALKRK